MSRRFKTDREILDACFAQDRGALEEFTRKFSKLVYYSIHKAFKVRGVPPQPDEIEDLFGEIFLSLFDSDFAKLRSFEGRNECTLASWIRLISSRRTIDYMRERTRHQTSRPVEEGSSIENHPAPDTPEDEFIEKERSALAAEIIPDLPPDDLFFLSLYYEEELPPERIAEILGVSIGTVYSKKHRLHEKLRKMLKEKKEL